MILADAHLHLFRRGFPGVYGHALLGSEIDVYEAFRAKHDIAAGLIVGYQGDGIDPENNAYIRELAATRPWMATLAYVEPAAMPPPATIAALLAAGHAGLAVYVPDDGAVAALSRMGRGDVARARRAARQSSRSTSACRRIGALAANRGRRAALPADLLAHGHAGHAPRTPTPDAARAELAPLLALAAHPNVFVKLSGFYAVSDPSHAWPHPAAAPLVDGAGRGLRRRPLPVGLRLQPGPRPRLLRPDHHRPRPRRLRRGDAGGGDGRET